MPLNQESRAVLFFKPDRKFHTPKVLCPHRDAQWQQVGTDFDFQTALNRASISPSKHFFSRLSGAVCDRHLCSQWAILFDVCNSITPSCVHAMFCLKALKIAPSIARLRAIHSTLCNRLFSHLFALRSCSDSTEQLFAVEQMLRSFAFAISFHFTIRPCSPRSRMASRIRICISGQLLLGVANTSRCDRFEQSVHA
eukprot:6199066-Pleurochrysis_carterae.AAC.6